MHARRYFVHEHFVVGYEKFHGEYAHVIELFGDLAGDLSGALGFFCGGELAAEFYLETNPFELDAANGGI